MGGPEKISSDHLARIACTYVRQSTPAQVRNNSESRERQYELSERAVGLGWPAERVRVIDADLGSPPTAPPSRTGRGSANWRARSRWAGSG